MQRYHDFQCWNHLPYMYCSDVKNGYLSLCFQESMPQYHQWGWALPVAVKMLLRAVFQLQNVCTVQWQDILTKSNCLRCCQFGKEQPIFYRWMFYVPSQNQREWWSTLFVTLSWRKYPMHMINRVAISVAFVILLKRNWRRLWSFTRSCRKKAWVSWISSSWFSL